MSKRVVVVGQGYVGLPLAIRAARSGHQVVGFDVDVNRIKMLVAGESPVEDVSAGDLAPLLESGRYVPTADERDLAAFDIAMITVPTPLRAGVPDLTYVEAACRTLARYVRPGATVVLESTTYPGTTEELMCPLLEEGSGLTAGEDFHVGYSPERIDPGNRSWDVANTPKLVAGLDVRSKDVLIEFYGTLTSAPVPVSTPRVAEFAKLLENTFRHVNVALINELAMAAHDLGIDIGEVIDAASTKPFGFMRFTPGPGVGGHCLPIDPEYLAWRVHRELGRPLRFVELASQINTGMPAYVVQRLTRAFNARGHSVSGRRVLLLGLAYKPNTSDCRESPALDVAEALLRLGARVRAADPHVPEGLAIEPRVERVSFGAEELRSADAVVLLADHDAFDYQLVQRCSRYVLDCRRRLQGNNVELL